MIRNTLKKLIVSVLTVEMMMSPVIDVYAEESISDSNINKTEEYTISSDYAENSGCRSFDDEALNPTYVNEDDSYSCGYITEEASRFMSYPYAHLESDKLLKYFDEKYPICRDQGSYGTCWAFAALSSAEFYMIKHGYAKKSINTSELALAYYSYHQNEAGIAGDNKNKLSYTTNIDFDYNNFLNNGGNNIIAAQTLFQLNGIMAESDLPYEKAYDLYSVDKTGGFCLVPEERKNSFYLMNVINYDKRNIDLIKESIVENGALSASILYRNKYYDINHNSYFVYDGSIDSNHSVSIVGWDDDFSAWDFLGIEGYEKPRNNGAWLIRNSYNEDNDKAHLGVTGYFWLSYEDPSLGNITSFQAVSSGEYPYDNSYYYDTQIYYPRFFDEGEYSANIYKVKNEGGEILSAVTFDVLDTDPDGTEYMIEVYKDVKEGEAPDSGVLVPEATTMGTIRNTGTYTVELEKEVELEYGENYAISIRRSDGHSITFATDFDKEDWYVKTEINTMPGQSFKKNEGEEWTDNENYGNFIIHALTKNKAKTIDLGYYFEKPINFTIDYQEKTGYKKSGIKVKADIKPVITDSVLYDYAKELSVTGDITEDIIKWTFPVKNNKKVYSESYFTVKAKINVKRAKACGITGSKLKELKKIVAAFNHQSKRKEYRQYFTITSVK